MTISMPSPGILLTSDDLQRWREEVDSIDLQIGALVARKELLRRRLEAATALVGLIEEERPKQGEILPPMTEITSIRPEANNETFVDASSGDDVTWVGAVRTRIYANELGIVSHELKQQIANSSLGDKLSFSNKGYYTAITRLAGRGEIVKHNGRLFSPQAYSRYQQAVANGEIADNTPPSPIVRSPMGEAISQIVEKMPGATSGQIIRELQRDAELAAALHPKVTVAYNIMMRLRGRGQLVKRGAGWYPAPKRNEAPNGHARGASLGEDAVPQEPPSLWNNPQPADTERR